MGGYMGGYRAESVQGHVVFEGGVPPDDCYSCKGVGGGQGF